MKRILVCLTTLLFLFACQLESTNRNTGLHPWPTFEAQEVQLVSETKYYQLFTLGVRGEDDFSSFWRIFNATGEVIDAHREPRLGYEMSEADIRMGHGGLVEITIPDGTSAWCYYYSIERGEKSARFHAGNHWVSDSGMLVAELAYAGKDENPYIEIKELFTNKAIAQLHPPFSNSDVISYDLVRFADFDNDNKFQICFLNKNDAYEYGEFDW
jgi:hypothetical protein